MFNFPFGCAWLRDGETRRAGWHNRASGILLGPLLPLFERERAAGRPLVLGVVLETAGSTYRKPGALMLIAADGEYSGLLSGGCLEGDLREHADSVRETGEPRIVSYDLRGPDDLLWGLGVGCEGAMKILLMRAPRATAGSRSRISRRALASHTPLRSEWSSKVAQADLPAGAVLLPDGNCSRLGARGRPRLRAGDARAGTVGWIDSTGVTAVRCSRCRWRCRRESCCSAPVRTRLPIVDFARAWAGK